MRSLETLSLPVLLSRVLGHFATEMQSADAGHAVPSLAVWSNVLRCVSDVGPDGISESALPSAARLSRRLATAAVTGAARRGWISVSEGDGKKRQVQLAELGLAAANIWPTRLAALDAAKEHIRMRMVLEGLVRQLPFELPHFPASYGAADPSAIGGSFVKPPKKTGIPAHGIDWSPVPRDDGDTVSSLPLTVLLSQTLMALTTDYESHFPWPLASTATVLCHLGAEPRPLAEVPGEHGIAGNGKSLLERHLIATVSRDPADARRKLVALTDRGLAVMQHHPARLAAVEEDWRERFGPGTVTELRDALIPVAKLASNQPDHVIAPLHNG
ncbi:MAG: MarR family winged helix-turn-helix transcriptional regulator [Actinobacteria bacterium]|nr:MarR family winged helix-turn-helix transcriptional regulator [Actinomycetota bacterium]